MSKWVVKINGVHQSAMPKAPKTAKNVPIVCKSEVHSKYTDLLRYAAFEIFVDSQKHALVVQHSAKSQTLEVSLNKANENFTGTTFSDTSIFPITLSDDDSGLKALVDWDEGILEYILDLNEEPFENLVYLEPSHNPDNNETMTISAKITINGKLITDGGGIEWQPYVLQHAIYSQVDDSEPITSIKIEDIKQTSTEVLNEMFALLAI